MVSLEDNKLVKRANNLVYCALSVKPFYNIGPEGSSLLGRMNRFLNAKSTDRRTDPEMELTAHGYAFSQEEEGGQEKVTRAYDTTKPVKKRSGRSKKPH
jgi:hypothetical protein